MLNQKEELATRLEQLLASEEFEKNLNECGQIIESYLNLELQEQSASGAIEYVDDEILEEAQATLDDEAEADSIESDVDSETEEEVEVITPQADPVYERFISLIDKYNDKRAKLLEMILSEEEENAKTKNALLAEFKSLIQEEEHIGKAFREFNSIRDRWNDVGRVSTKHHHNLQHEYSNLIDLFYYNINIYKQLQEHDLKRNLELKLEVLEKLKSIKGETVIKKLDEGINICIHQWNEIGPTAREDWDKLKDEFWTLVREYNARIRSYYDDQREQQESNLAHKTTLVEKALALADLSIENQNEWQQKTDEIIAIQEEWKSIGYATKEKNEEVWKQFRKACDKFFEQKRAFFEVIRKEQEVIAKKKEALITQAESYKDSQDWKKATEALIQLQKQWKEVGSTSQKLEQKLWRKFRGACDAFFNGKKKFFASQDSRQAENLKLKEVVIKELNDFKLSGEKIKDLASLKEFSTRFNEIDHVPFKEKERIYSEFRNAMDEKYKSMKIDKVERETHVFKARVETLKSGSNDYELRKEEKFTRDKMEKLKSEVIQFENNLGFFANSKGADLLKQEVEKKIEKTREEIELLKKKLKMIRNA